MKPKQLKNLVTSKYRNIKKFFVSKYYQYKYKSSDTPYVEWLQLNLNSLSRTTLTPHSKIEKTIITEICKALWSYKHVIGLQPMSGPVGLTYVLRTKNKEEERRLSLEILSSAVEARTRQLHSTFSMEAIQDANATHDLDVSNVIIHAVVQSFVSEILTHYFNHASDIATNKFNYDIPQNDEQRRLFEIGLNVACISIATKSLRGPGNQIIIPPQYAELISSLPSFVDLHGQELIGTVNGVNVYVLPINTDKILIAYHGSSATDTGLQYCPYTVYQSNIMVDPTTFQPVYKLMTRYALNQDDQSADYYSTITLQSE